MALSCPFAYAVPIALPIAMPMAVPLAMVITVAFLMAMPMAAPIGCACYMFLNFSYMAVSCTFSYGCDY